MARGRVDRDRWAILPERVLDLEELVRALEHHHACHFGMPVIRAEFEAERAIGIAVLMARPALGGITRANDQWRFREEGRIGKSHLILVTVSFDDGIDAETAAFQLPRGPEQRFRGALQIFDTRPLLPETLWFP